MRAPRLRSVLASSLLVFGLLTVLGWGVSALDGRLAGVLAGSPLPGSTVFGVLALLSLVSAVVQSFRLPLAPTGDAVPYLRRERRVLLVVLVSLAAALVCGLCWAAGRV